MAKLCSSKRVLYCWSFFS